MPPRTPPAPSGNQSMDSILVDIAIAVIVFFLIAFLFKTFFSSLFGSYLNFITWFYSGSWYFVYVIITIFVSVVDAILLYFAIIFVKRFYRLDKEVPPEQIQSKVFSSQEEFMQNWQAIRELADSPSASDWNMAILRADAQLDDTLDHLGYEGETIAERLKIVDPTKLKSMDRVWSAHRLRNTIAHDPLQEYTREMMTHALQSYEIAFKELGVLQEVEDVEKEK